MGSQFKKNEEQDPLRIGQNIQTGRRRYENGGIELIDTKKQDDKGFVLETYV